MPRAQPVTGLGQASALQPRLRAASPALARTTVRTMATLGGSAAAVQCRPGYCRQVLTCDGQRDALAHGGRDVVLGDAEVGAAVPPGDGSEGDQGAGHAVRVGTWAVCVETGGTIVAVYWWPSPRGAVTLSVDNHHCPQLLSALCVSPHRTSAGSVSPSRVSR